MRKNIGLKKQNKILTDEVLRLTQELALERAVPTEGLKEVGRLYVGLSEGGRQHVSLGFNQPFKDDEQATEVLGHILFAVFNMMRDLKGKDTLAGNVSINTADSHLGEFDDFFKYVEGIVTDD